MLRGKYALVTGGSDGIGLAIAEQFVRNGASVCLVGRDRGKLDQAISGLRGLGAEVVGLDFDLTDTAGIADCVKRLWTVFPRLDILVNNAGVGQFVAFSETDQTLLERHLNLNVKAPYFLTQTVLPALLESRGSVLNISSYFSHRMLRGRHSTAYSLSKGALDSFTKALAFEMGPYGVRVNAIAPGSVQTAQLAFNLTQLDTEAQAAFHEMIAEIYPLGKIGEPLDIAYMAVFLSSEQARWITGSVMAVDGGLTTN
ncbi:SDR family NAD(P)-dependent oxidoreductase [Flavobacterium sp. JP2137]|uniref:SDR family NAD(P)-dependent oxidoreductase n=1 Tax=Flavobacterium sp. JP2137 TaxID=3414510 RepID=UPI003D2FF6CE